MSTSTLARAIGTLLLTATIWSTANAALIDRGDYATDTHHHLDWLKLGNLVGYSYEQVLAGAQGYTASGWRFATQSEVLALFTHYIGEQDGSVNNIPLSGQDPSYLSGAERLVIALGMNLAFNDPRATLNSTAVPEIHSIHVQGFIDPTEGGQSPAIASAAAVLGDTRFDYNGFGQPFGIWAIVPQDRPFGSSNVSSFLVREWTRGVPEPSTWGLLVTAFFVMVMVARRSSNRNSERRLFRSSAPLAYRL